jgi:hypothetical protein
VHNECVHWIISVTTIVIINDNYFQRKLVRVAMEVESHRISISSRHWIAEVDVEQIPVRTSMESRRARTSAYQTERKFVVAVVCWPEIAVCTISVLAVFVDEADGLHVYISRTTGFLH